MENANSIQQNPTNKRFIIVICLFIGIFIAYLDRVNVSVLAANDPFLLEMGIKDTPVRIGMMMSVFLAAYGISNVVLSPIGDYLGPRKSMMLCIVLWTISLFIGGIATSFMLIIVSRIILGIGEGTIPCKVSLSKTGSPNRNGDGPMQPRSWGSPLRLPSPCPSLPGSSGPTAGA